MHHFRVTSAISLVKQVENLLLKSLAILVDSLSSLTKAYISCYTAENPKKTKQTLSALGRSTSLASVPSLLRMIATCLLPSLPSFLSDSNREVSSRENWL